MIKSIVEYLRISLLETGYFQQVFGLCLQVNKGGVIFPALYVTKDSLQDVTLFDRYDGMAYFRKDGDTEKEPFTGVKTVSCATNSISVYSYNLKLIGCVPKSKASCDDAYSDDEICNTITSTIDNPADLKAELRAQAVSVLTTGFSTDSAKILQQEYPGRKKEDFNYNFAYFSIKIKAQVTISQVCFEQNCYNGISQN
jgi:hypothetical protein